MAKLEITKKLVKGMFPNTVKIGYCEAQFLLRCLREDFYTHGVYGWNADIYVYNDETAIVSGYRPFGNIEPTHEELREYDIKARNVWEADGDYMEKRKKVRTLLAELLHKYGIVDDEED